MNNICSLNKDFKVGIFRANPIFILLLGLCPALAISISIDNALGMTAAVTFVLLGANIIVAAIRRYVPQQVRIPVFIVIIATLVTIVDLLLQGFAPALSKSLGIFIPLIVVNCIILARAEAFASKQRVGRSIMDALGMGVGFGWGLVLISLIRQLLGTGSLSLFGRQLFTIPGLAEDPAIIFLFPMGAFFVVGLLLALFKWLEGRNNA